MKIIPGSVLARVRSGIALEIDMYIRTRCKMRVHCHANETYLCVIVAAVMLLADGDGAFAALPRLELLGCAEYLTILGSEKSFA